METTIKKAVLCNITREPIAVVNVPAATRSIRLAGEYTADGKAVNVGTNKVTANARTLAKTEAMDVPVAQYHKESETYFLPKGEF